MNFLLIKLNLQVEGFPVYNLEVIVKVVPFISVAELNGNPLKKIPLSLLKVKPALSYNFHLKERARRKERFKKLRAEHYRMRDALQKGRELVESEQSDGDD